MINSTIFVLEKKKKKLQKELNKLLVINIQNKKKYMDV